MEMEPKESVAEKACKSIYKAYAAQVFQGIYFILECWFIFSENCQTLLIVDFKSETEKSFPSCKPTLSSDIRT